MRPAEYLDGAVDSVVTALRPGTDQDWQIPAGTLDWTCRVTAEHAAHCMQAYAMQRASR
ncbi:hypothetical protein [Actinopolymorpha alba]|uniref:hypothetical protein n=1 Tax=Actinopolymorpha alba TaxID=533267 RepID=UPI0012F6A30D|nr:hypothetical protein [Actinopolymorpha alba]